MNTDTPCGTNPIRSISAATPLSSASRSKPIIGIHVNISPFWKDSNTFLFFSNVSTSFFTSILFSTKQASSAPQRPFLHVAAKIDFQHSCKYPPLVKKQQTSLSGDIEEKILSMYAKGMTTRDIDAHIREIYGLEVSDSTVSRITDKILPVVKEWQQRPLEEIYAVVCQC